MARQADGPVIGNSKIGDGFAYHATAKDSGREIETRREDRYRLLIVYQNYCAPTELAILSWHNKTESAGAGMDTQTPPLTRKGLSHEGAPRPQVAGRFNAKESTTDTPLL